MSESTPRGNTGTPKGSLQEQARVLARRISRTAGTLPAEITLMEVCGTHTVNLRRSGIHSMLPPNIRLISGPGCPVCVTPASYIDNALELIEKHDALVATFGDMVKVPGVTGRSLAAYMGSGQLKIVYSPADVLTLAREQDRPVVFLGIGFETTIPVIASVFLKAAEQGLENLFLYPAFKTVPPALRALLADPDCRIDGFILPGHVSVIIGEEAYSFLEGDGDDQVRGGKLTDGGRHGASAAGGRDETGDGGGRGARGGRGAQTGDGKPARSKGREGEPAGNKARSGLVPGAITGFEPLDMLYGIYELLGLVKAGRTRVVNCYTRAVKPQGNPNARAAMEKLLRPEDALWRGLGTVPASGMGLREEFASLDAATVFSLEPLYDYEPSGCLCAQVIQGKVTPPECPQFGRGCTPEQPVGPCMVSSEGSCAAYLRYGEVA